MRHFGTHFPPVYAGTVKAYPDAHMTKVDASDDIGTAQVEDLETLQRHVSALAREAEAATQIYDRTAWIAYVSMFIAIPFAVLLFRLHMQAWHYYVAGALFLACAVVIFAMDFAGTEKRDKAVRQRSHARS